MEPSLQERKNQDPTVHTKDQIITIPISILIIIIIIINLVFNKAKTVLMIIIQPCNSYLYNKPTNRVIVKTIKIGKY